jgi:hypothetical protein
MDQAQLKALIAQHTPPKRKHEESNLSKQIVKRALQLGCKLWRNQVGTYLLKDGRYITSGLCVGSSDYIGYTVRTITPDMVGKRIAVFTAIEAKRPGARNTATDRQVEFVERVNSDGGIAQIVDSLVAFEHAIK